MHDPQAALILNKLCRENVYVRVIGNLKSFNNKRSVNATVVKPVKDLNEVQYHLLEAIRVHLYHTRGPLDVSACT